MTATSHAIAPEKFTPEMGIYLGLRSLYWSLAQAKNDDALRDVVKQMWAFATMLEDGNLSDAQARLRNAEEALRQALDRNASDEEIKRLMDELRRSTSTSRRSPSNCAGTRRWRARSIPTNSASCAPRISRACSTAWNSSCARARRTPHGSCSTSCRR